MPRVYPGASVGAGATFNVAGAVNGTGDLTAEGTKSSASTVTISNGATQTDNAPSGVYTDAAGDRSAVNYLDYDPAGGDGVFDDVSLTVLSLAMPEPSTYALALGGLAAVVAMVGAVVRSGRL